MWNKIITRLTGACLLAHSSCATIKIKYLQNHDVDSLQSISFAPTDIRRSLDKIESLRRKIQNYNGQISETEYEYVIREIVPLVEEYKKYSAYAAVAAANRGAIVVPPKTKLTLRLNTYCLTPHKAVPSEDEPFILTKSDPDIPLYKEIMLYTNTKEHVSQSLKQGLLWNLKNKANFEDLPSEERELLLRVDSAAAWKINSRLKKTFLRKIGDFITGILPNFGRATKITEIAEGKAHTFRDYAKRLESLKSKHEKPANDKPIKADGYEIYTTVKADGFTEAVVTFINLTDKEQKISSHFKPLRKDVQPLGFDIPDWDELHRKYTSEFASLISYLLLMMDYVGPGDASMAQNNPDRITDILLAFRDRNKAYAMTEKIFGRNNEGDISDAFRHAYWNALMARDIGPDFATEISYYHELNPGNAKDIKEKELTEKLREMDLHNNKIGRDIGNRLKNNGITDDKHYADEILKNKDSMIVIYHLK